jgi:uncharacterized protein (TIGR02598 family)
MHSKTKNNSGFTLVEVAIAVAILGIALITLIGLHSKMLDTYLEEKNRLQAALVAQYIMTNIEVLQKPPAAGTKDGDLEDHLKKLGYFSDEGLSAEDDKRFAGWKFQQTVEEISLPLASQEQSEDAMRRIQITVSWGESVDETFSLEYYFNNPIKNEPQI